MKRDWMQIGRRPAGVCGAALYIAARIHRVVVPKLIILQTVKVCDMTLRRRVVEFRDAPSAQLTKQEFWKANPDYKGNPEDDLTDNTSENPPVYKQHRKKEAEDERRRRAQLRQQQAPETRAKKTATRAGTSMGQDEEPIEGRDEAVKASGSAPRRTTFGEATDEDREEAEAIAAATELLGTADVEKAQENAKKRKMPASNSELSAPAAKRMSNDEQEMNSQFDAMIEEENQGDIDGDKESNYGHGVEEQMESALKEGGKFVKANVESINQPTLAAVPDPEDEEAVKAAIVAKAKAAAAAAAALASEVFDASDIPDEDVEEYINTEDQYVIKSMLWEELNKEWIEDQAEKERLAAEQAATGVVPKKRARKAKSAEERAAEANTPKEKSTRINQDALNAARLRREAGGARGGGARRHELEGMEDDEDDFGVDEEDDELGIRPRPARPPPSAFLGSLRPTIPTTQNPTQSTQATQAYGAEDEDDDEEEEDDEAPKTNFRSQVFGAHDEEEEDYY
jgi:transcription factor IIIB subunit 2